MPSSGLQHNCFLADDCSQFRIIQYFFLRLWINFFSLGWCFLPKISQIAVPSEFNEPWFNSIVLGGILGNRNVGDQATPLSAYTPPRELRAVMMQPNPNLNAGILSKKGYRSPI